MIALLFMLCFVSCADDSLVPESELEGIPVPVKIYLSAPEAEKQVSSRVSDEYNIQDFYLFVFNTSGKLTFKKYYIANDLVTSPNVQGGITTLDANYVVETLQSGEAYIYGVANIESGYYTGLKAQLDAFTVGDNCMEAFTKLKLTNAKTSLDRTADTYMLMSGTCKEGDKDTYTIAKDKDIKTVHLRRIDSQITFNFSEGTNCTSFKATRWYIENAPIHSYLIEQPAGTGTDCTWDASVNLGNEDTSSDFFSTYSETEGDLKEVLNNTFTFYMPENRKNGDSGNINSYADRELQVKTNRKNGAWKYAPLNGTYVVVHGIYEGTATHSEFGNNQPVTANVTYKIHLGYVNDNPDDFFSKRNTKYTYNVTINGVDNIVLEVETSGGDDAPTENAPGATGEVVFNNETKLFNLDAHYEQILLTFNKDELAARYKEDFQCIVSTPFTQYGVSRTVDMDWVKVLKNSDASQDFQAYPGNTSTSLQSVNDMLTDLYYASHPDDTEGKPNKDYNDFFTDDGQVTYTCYVNEFYYESLPTGSLLTVDNNVPLWKYFVNQADRKMYIVCHTDLSDDNESSIVSSEYLISQRSIQTFYNYSDKTLTGLTKAYGLETINETGWLEWGNPTSNPTDPDFGWDNTKAMIPSNGAWASLVNIANNGYKSVGINTNMNKTVDDEHMITVKYANTSDTQYYMQGMNTNYQKAYIACMQRNRDNDGMDDIDDDEIRWYLAAYNQYVGMYIGEASLSPESRLYYYPETYLPYQNLKHYVSSTISGNSPLILWSEEAVSFSTLSNRIDWGNQDYGNAPEVLYPNEDKWNGWAQSKIHYRCVRNLGTISEHYDNYVIGPESKPSSGTTTIDPKYLNFNINSKRSDTKNELDPHTYQPDEMDNKLSGAFEVYFDSQPSSNLEKAITPPTITYTYTYTEQTASITQTRNNRNSPWPDVDYDNLTWSNGEPKVIETTEEMANEESVNWNYYNNNNVNRATERSGTATRITIISVTSKEQNGTTATGCENITVLDGEAKWRAPNIREFALMEIFGLLEAQDVCRTRLGYDNYRKGWFYNNGVINMGSNDYNQGNSIRCVRDKID